MTDETSNTDMEPNNDHVICPKCAEHFGALIATWQQQAEQLQAHLDRVLAREVALAEAHNALARNHIQLLRAHGALRASIASNNDINPPGSAPRGLPDSVAARPEDGTRDGAGTWLDGRWHPDCLQPLQPPIEDGDGGIHFFESADQPDWKCDRAGCDIAIPHEHLSHAQVQARQLSAAARMANTFADSERPRPNSRVLPPDQLPASMQPQEADGSGGQGMPAGYDPPTVGELKIIQERLRPLSTKEPTAFEDYVDGLPGGASDETTNTPDPNTEAR